MDKYLSIEGVGMSFGASEILTGIDLTIRKGEFVTLIGHSGCGKSTLLNLLGLFDRATQGEITFAGQSVTKLRDAQLAMLRNPDAGLQSPTFWAPFVAIGGTTANGASPGSSFTRSTLSEVRDDPAR